MRSRLAAASTAPPHPYPTVPKLPRRARDPRGNNPHPTVPKRRLQPPRRAGDPRGNNPRLAVPKRHRLSSSSSRGPHSNSGPRSSSVSDLPTEEEVRARRPALMAAEQGDGGEGGPPPARSGGWMERAEDRWHKIREHAETYPYVWASYIFVYGGLGVYITWRWRKLRQTEERVRVLQEQLRKLVEAEEAAATGSKPNGSSPLPPPDKASPR